MAAVLVDLNSIRVHVAELDHVNETRFGPSPSAAGSIMPAHPPLLARSIMSAGSPLLASGPD